MHKPFSPSRRRLLAGLGSASALGLAATPFLKTLAATGTNSASDYKALVCVFLLGGNDAYNTVLATDSASWSAYTAARNVMPQSLALAPPGTPRVASADINTPAAYGGVLPIVPRTAVSGRSFALHPMLPSIRDMFASGRAAIVANVGTLVQPTTRDDYLAGRGALPPRLFSHNDQQSMWQSSAAESPQFGWGGAMADLFTDANASAAAFSAVSATGSSMWLAGRNVNMYQVNTNGPVIAGFPKEWLYGSRYGWDQLYAALRTTRADPLEQDQVALITRSMGSASQLSAVLPGTGSGGVLAAPLHTNPLTGAVGPNPLSQQLEIVARMIAARTDLGAKRQVFFVTLSGFDTHVTQNQGHTDLMAKLDGALAYFNSALASLPGGDASSLVTTFTASDFGRTLQSNGTGTDHGWGGHHFVMGGAVQGGDIYGQFPTIGLSTATDAGNGRLIPTTSVDQYGASLASWFGATGDQLDAIFPNLRNFGSARTLGLFRG